MIKRLLGPLAVLLLAGCASLSYYAQAVGGHLEVMRAARPIDELVADPATDGDLRARLERVRAIRAFASRELGLPDNGSYRSYADLGRPFVVWNVFATAELSLTPKTWCLLVVGCVSYRGFHQRQAAEQLAAELRAQGLDVFVGGVAAYSTLGYFNDPVLNTFLRFGELEAARLIFHELSHQRVFAAGDTRFNESFATAVENEGVRRWLARAAPARAQAFAGQQQRRARFVGLVADYRQRLELLYASDLPAAEKRRAKGEVLAGLRQDYAALKAERGWGGDDSYDRWFAEDLNNAKIAALGTYSQLLPAFEAMLAAAGNDLPRFYQRVAALARLPPAERDAVLTGLPPEH